MRQSSVEHAYAYFGGMVPRKIFALRCILSYFSVLFIIQIKLSCYLKFSIDIITNSVRVGDCFIAINDCSIRQYFNFIIEVEEGWGHVPPWSPGLSKLQLYYKFFSVYL